MLTGFSGLTGVLLNMLLKASLEEEEAANDGYSSYLGGSGGTGFTKAIPDEAWKPSFASITSSAGSRSAAQYRKVIDQFNVESNKRYTPGENTYCNIFIWDVTRAMNAEIPHYINAETNKTDALRPGGIEPNIRQRNLPVAASKRENVWMA